MQPNNLPTAELAAQITRKASKQTYTTIRSLVPIERQDDAFRAYAYFRWLDDLLDGDALDPRGRLALITSQQELLHRCLTIQQPRDLSAEEWMLADLLQGPLGNEPGLRTYLNDMMAVMEFDMHRRGRRITRQELDGYSRRLATAVTEAVYTFVGDDCGAPLTKERYLAADAAHIVHMLRDLRDDLEAGYINIPVEVIAGDVLEPGVLESGSMRTWVRERIETARTYFSAGADYLAMIENPRCRLAGAWYAARFEGVMEAIEREGYLLRKDYRDCKGARMILRMAWQSAAAVLTPAALARTNLAHPLPGHANAWTSVRSRANLIKDGVQE